QVADLLMRVGDLRLVSGGGGGAAEQGQHGRRLLLGVSVGVVGGLAGDAQGGADVGPGRALGLGGGDQRPVDRAGRSGEVVGGGQRLQGGDASLSLTGLAGGVAGEQGQAHVRRHGAVCVPVPGQNLGCIHDSIVVHP